MNTNLDLVVSHQPQRAAPRITMLVGLIVVVVGIFAGRTALAAHGPAPRLFAIFNAVTFLGALGILLAWGRALRRQDWGIALATGALLGFQQPFTGFYPLIELGTTRATAIVHGAAITTCLLAGIAIMRHDGPVVVRVARGEWRRAVSGVVFGALLGLPLAVFNAYANALTQGRPWVLQRSAGPLVEALQPGIVEEIVYRLAFLGLVWLLVRRLWPRQAVVIAATLSLLVHAYSHLDTLLLDRPLFAVAYGAVMALLWGVPMTVLAVRRDLETAAGFHWIQDALRFLGGL